MKNSLLRFVAGFMVFLMLVTVWCPGTFAVFIDAPEAVSLSGVPSVWFEEHPEWQAVYERSWEIHSEMIRQIGIETNPEGTYYVDEAFNTNIFLWDTSFMMLFDKYGYFEFPTLESMNNFYYNQHDEEGEKYGFICRVISEKTGADVWPNEVANGQNKELASINPPLLSWAEWEQYQIHGDMTRFETEINGKTIFERLCNFFDYIENSRKKANGLYGGVNGYAIGLDNTPNQDHEELSWGEEDGAQTYNDLSIQQAQNAYYLALIAAEIGDAEKQAYYQAKYEELVELINDLLWDEETGIYSNLATDGSTKTNVSTPTSLWAMLAGVATEETAAAMIEKHALNSEKLYRPGGLSSLEYDWDGATTSYIPEGGYWRGGIWAPTSYAYLKGLENYGYYDLAFQEAVRHLNTVTAASEWDNTLYENYSAEYDMEDTVDGQRRPDFVGWTGCLSIGVIIENVIGIHPNAINNAVDWYPALTEAYGIENLRFGENSIGLNVQARKTAESAVTFTVEADEAFTFNVHLNGENHALAIPAGKSTHTVGAATAAEGGYLGVSVQKAEDMAEVLPAETLDLVTFTETLNENVDDGIGYQTTGTGLLYNINSVGYYWGGSESYSDNPVTIAASDITAVDYAVIKKNHQDGDEGFMAMAPAGLQGKTMRLVVGVSGGDAILKASLSDASDASVELRLTDGEYVIDLPYRADGEGRSLLAQWVIDNDTAQTDAAVSLMAVALLEGAEETVGIPVDVVAGCSEGKLKVEATPAFGESYDSYAIYYGTERSNYERREVETLPALIKVEQYQSYYVAVAGIRDGCEGEKAEAAEPAFVEAEGLNDYARALEDIDQTLPLIMGQNTEKETIAWYRPIDTGVAYGSTITFSAQSNTEGYGVQNDGSVVFPPADSVPVQSKITLTATLNGVTAERVVYTNINPVSLEKNKAVFVGSEDATASAPMTVNLTKIGSLDWVQFTDGSSFSLANMAQKKNSSIITDVYWADGGRQQTVTDNHFYYTATDGTAETVNRFALSTRYKGTSINVKLAGSTEARRINVYAGGWRSNYRVELLVNGQVAAAEAYSATAATSTRYTFDYQGSASDELQIRVVLLDPEAHGVTNGSAYISAVTVGDITEERVAALATKDATSSAYMNVDLTAVGSLDWVQFTDASSYSLTNMAQKKDASVIEEIYWSDGAKKGAVTDNYYNYTASDGTAATVNRYALSTRYQDSSINVKMSGSDQPRRIRVYAGGWKAKYRVDLLVNGQTAASIDGDTGSEQLSTLYTFDYQGMISDEVLIRVVLTDPAAYDVTNGSAYVSAIAIEEGGFKAAFSGSENATGTNSMNVDLSSVGGLDWVQFTDGASFLLSNMAQKKDSSIINDVYWADGGRQQSVTDNYFYYTATDGTAATVDRYALSTRNVNSSINIKMDGSDQARRIRLYAGGWKSDYRVDLLVNGQVESTANGSTGAAQVSALYTFEYQGSASDEVVIRVVLTDPAAHGATNGSAYVSAVAVEDLHVYGAWETITPATETAEGLGRRGCINAGCNAKDEQALPMLLGCRMSDLKAVIDRIESMDTQWYKADDVTALLAMAVETENAMGEMDDAELYAAEKALLIAASSMELTAYPPISAQGTLPMEPAFYVISTVEDYNDWADAVNNGRWGRSGVMLGASIDLSAVTVSVNGFEGVFDGNGYTLSNLNTAMFNSFAGTIRDLTCDGFARTGTAQKQAALIDSTCGEVVLENITMKNCTLTNGYGISGLMVGQPGGALTFTDIRMENCSASFINNGGGKGLLLGGGVDGSTWHAITMDRITMVECSLVSAAQNRSSQRAGMLAGEAVSDGDTVIRNVLQLDCSASAPISSDNSVWYDPSVIACRMGTDDKITSCLILGGDYGDIKNVSSVNNHGMVSRCYWDGDENTDLKTVSAEALRDGSLAYLLSQSSGQWTVRNGATALKADDEQQTYQVCFAADEKEVVLYTDSKGQLIGDGYKPIYNLWKLDDEVIQNDALATKVFSADTTLNVSYWPGDLNGNGQIDLADVIILLQYLVGYSLEFKSTADMNGDGRVSIFDAVLLLKMVNG